MSKLRDVAQALVYLGVLVGLQLLLHFLLQRWSLTDKTVLSPDSTGGVVLGGVFAAVGLALYVAVVRGFERRTVVEIAFAGRSLRVLFAGLVGGVGLFGTAVLLLLVLGHATIHGGGSARASALAFGSALFAAVGEELVFRGVVFRLLARNVRLEAAVLLSGLMFGLLHLGTPHSGIVPAIAIAIEAGILLSVAFWFDRTLWLPIGIHAGWNFAEGGVFGADVSGFTFQGLLDSRIDGPSWLTGGAFGLEASVPAILVCLAATIGLVAWRRAHRLPPDSVFPRAR